MDVRLIYKQGSKRHVFRLTRSEAIIGRARGCAVRIPSADVSRTHCRLVRRDGAVTVEDLGSLNGTLLNGTAIEGIVEVQPGDQLTIGPVRFVVEYEISAAAEAEIEDAFELVDDEPPAADNVFEIVDDAPSVNSTTAPDVSQWQPATGDNLRDLLAQIDQSEEVAPPPPFTPGKKKKPRKG
jgi:pSer/pThr/pTyr-binding forkhead associated (FHA) protein